MGLITACGGGSSNSDGGSSNNAGNPEVAGNYVFRGQGNANGENFNATFTANTFKFDTEDNDNGTFNNPKQISLALSSGEKIPADIEADANNKVVKITTRAPDGTTFVGTRR